MNKNELVIDFELGPVRKSRILINGEVYLRRIEFRTRKFSIKLHCFHKGDDDRALHTHPWAWWYTFPLCRGYTEVRSFREVIGRPPQNAFNEYLKWRVRGWRFHRRGEHKHRVVMEPGDKPFWTLIVCGPVVREWGFFPPGKPYVPHYEWTGE